MIKTHKTKKIFEDILKLLNLCININRFNKKYCQKILFYDKYLDYKGIFYLWNLDIMFQIISNRLEIKFVFVIRDVRPVFFLAAGEIFEPKKRVGQKRAGQLLDS